MKGKHFNLCVGVIRDKERWGQLWVNLIRANKCRPISLYFPASMKNEFKFVVVFLKNIGWILQTYKDVF